MGQLILNHRSDNFCDFMSDQSVLVTCILAQKHNLQILEGKVLFRDFIEYKYVKKNANSHDFLIKLMPRNGH